MTDYRGPLCGDPTCEICPTQDDIDAWHEGQQEAAREIVRYTLGLPAVSHDQ